jgi:hypothetical protein
MAYTIKEIRKKVYLIESDTQYEIASMFLRPQEYYESPFENVRGKYFSLEEYMDTYARANGAFTYYTDWCGFNISSTVFKEFLKVFAYDLNQKENLLISLIRQLNPNLDGDFYIIGACKSKCNKETLLHETAHAYWFFDPIYKAKMEDLIANLSIEMYEDAACALVDRGYADRFVKDELQAYLATASREKILAVMDWKNRRIPQAIKKFFKEYDATHK